MSINETINNRFLQALRDQGLDAGLTTNAGGRIFRADVRTVWESVLADFLTLPSDMDAKVADMADWILLFDSSYYVYSGFRRAATLFDHIVRDPSREDAVASGSRATAVDVVAAAAMARYAQVMTSIGVSANPELWVAMAAARILFQKVQRIDAFQSRKTQLPLTSWSVLLSLPEFEHWFGRASSDRVQRVVNELAVETSTIRIHVSRFGTKRPRADLALEGLDDNYSWRSQISLNEEAFKLVPRRDAVEAMHQTLTSVVGPVLEAYERTGRVDLRHCGHEVHRLATGVGGRVA